MGAGIGRLRDLVGTPRRRHWARVILILCLVLGPGLYGWLSRPLAQEAPNLVGPKIVVLADKQNVAAVVNMTLSVGPGHSSTLQLAILPATTITPPVTLTVELDNFPSGTMGTSGTQQQLPEISPPAANSALASLPQAAPLSPRGYADYVVNDTITGQQRPALITIMTKRQPVGEARNGAQLRVELPELVGETPGTTGTPIPLQDLYSGAQASFASGDPLVLQAGTTTFTSQGTNLSEYQFLAGDSPVQLNNQWSWDGINDVTALAANVATQDAAQNQLFYSGIALGVAAGAVITLFLELIPADPVKPAGDARRAGAGAARPPG
jgi:hypothetical protein